MGRPRLQYLKQIARNNEKNSLQQIQIESCQLIKRFKEKEEVEGE
jgi:hypothetical protein